MTGELDASETMGDTAARDERVCQSPALDIESGEPFVMGERSATAENLGV